MLRMNRYIKNDVINMTKVGGAQSVNVIMNKYRRARVHTHTTYPRTHTYVHFVN